MKALLVESQTGNKIAMIIYKPHQEKEVVERLEKAGFEVEDRRHGY